MIDLYKKKETRPARKIFFIMLFSFVFITIFLLIFFRLRDSSISESVWRFGLKGQSIPNVFVSYLSSKKDLMQENIELKQKIDEIQLEILNSSVYKNENEKLKEILGRKYSADLVLAQILTRPNRSPYDILVVDIGQNESVKAGQKVFARGNIPIGEVAEVSRNTSRIKLYSTPGTETMATLESSDIDVSLIGTGSGGFEIILPKDVSVHVGQAILNKSINSKTIALVEGVVSTDRDSFKKVLAKSPVNIQELSWVQIEIEN